MIFLEVLDGDILQFQIEGIEFSFLLISQALHIITLLMIGDNSLGGDKLLGRGSDFVCSVTVILLTLDDVADHIFLQGREQAGFRRQGHGSGFGGRLFLLAGSLFNLIGQEDFAGCGVDEELESGQAAKFHYGSCVGRASGCFGGCFVGLGFFQGLQFFHHLGHVQSIDQFGGFDDGLVERMAFPLQEFEQIVERLIRELVGDAVAVIQNIGRITLGSGLESGAFVNLREAVEFVHRTQVFADGLGVRRCGALTGHFVDRVTQVQVQRTDQVAAAEGHTVGL